MQIGVSTITADLVDEALYIYPNRIPRMLFQYRHRGHHARSTPGLRFTRTCDCIVTKWHDRCMEKRRITPGQVKFLVIRTWQDINTTHKNHLKTFSSNRDVAEYGVIFEYIVL